MSENQPILVHRRGDTLIPHGPMDAEAIRAFDAGQPLRIEIKQPRNVNQMRLYFAMLALIRDNLPEPAPSVETLHAATKVMTGYTLTVHTARGDVVVPGSIAFNAMSQSEWRTFLDDFMKLVRTRIIPGMSNPAFEKAAREMMGEPIEEHHVTKRKTAKSDNPFEDDEGAETGDDPFAGSEEPETVEAAPEPLDSPHDGGLADIVDTETGEVVEADPNVLGVIDRMGEQRGRAGAEREPPPGLSEVEASAWFAAFDKGARERKARPTSTEPAPSAGQKRASSASATPASTPSAEATSSPTSPVEPSGSGEVEEPIADDIETIVGTAHLSDALENAIGEVAESGSFLAMKQIGKTLSLTDAWKTCEPEGKRMVFAAMWERYEELVTDGKEDGNVTVDLTLMRIWLEHGANTPVEIDARWKVFWRSSVFKDANADAKQLITEIMTTRKKELA
jgi:hypothetical protein